ERHQREQQRIGAGGDGDSVSDAEHRRELALERVDLGAHDETLAVGDAGHRGDEGVAQRAILRVEVEERYRHDVWLFYRRALTAARVSRSASRFFTVSRLSYSCLPFARLTATLTRPSLK